jgi:hypothetical protein
MGIAYNTSIVRDGLVLHLDAANVKSYPGTGTVWKDLSGLGNDGTLINGVGYDTANNGSLVFDGVNDYVLTNRIAGTGTSASSVSWGVWVSAAGTSGNIMSMSSTNPQGSWNMPPISAVGQKFTGKIWSNTRLTSATYIINTWYYLVLVWNSSLGSQSFYVNSLLQGTQTGISYSASNTNNFLFLGQSNPGADNTGMFSGKYGSFQVYNRALTPAEIKQNFEAMRGRYGI